MFATLVVCGIGAGLLGYLAWNSKSSTESSHPTTTTCRPRSGVDLIRQQPTPDVVKNLNASQLDPTKPSVKIQWSPPANCSRNDTVRYHIRYREKSSVHGQYIVPPESPVYRTTFTISSTLLQPLTSYVFEVRAERGCKFGEWSSVEFYVRNWQCRHPDCRENKIKIMQEEVIYDYCCLSHKKECDLKYCIYPECTEPKQHLKGKKKCFCEEHFCEEHFTKAINKGMSFLVCVERLSEEFKDVQKKFVKKWDSRKGHCPTIHSILAIVNPAVEEKFQRYLGKLPKKHRGTERYFHGTKLACFMDNYQTLCKDTGCGVCGIARRGFLSEHISGMRFQRLGPAFYFAPNSSKSHGYCGPQPARGSYWGMLLCKVAPGNMYSFRPRRMSQPVPDEPPEGYDSLYGKRKGIFFNSDLNYDELALFNEDAISPQYLVLYSFSAF